MINLEAMALKLNCWGQVSNMSATTIFSILHTFFRCYEIEGETYLKNRQQLGSISTFEIISRFPSFIEM